MVTGMDRASQSSAEEELAVRMALIESGCLDSREYIDQLKVGPSAEHEDRQDTAMQAMSGGLL